MSANSAARTASPTGAATAARCKTEAVRIGFLLQRDGPAATRAWVKRTLGIYRHAVLDRRNFASAPDYRRRYLQSCADFRRWLSACN